MREPELTLVLAGPRGRRTLADLPSRRLVTPGATAKATPALEPKFLSVSKIKINYDPRERSCFCSGQPRKVHQLHHNPSQDHLIDVPRQYRPASSAALWAVEDKPKLP